MSVSSAAWGGIREALGVDEGKGHYSRNAFQPNLSGMQRMEELHRAWAVLRSNGFGAANGDPDH